MNKTNFEIGRACGIDFEQVASLQNKNSITVLPENERGDGFLACDFSPEQFEEIDKSVALVVARDRSEVVGFVCASSIEFNEDSPLLATMIGKFPNIIIDGKSLNDLKKYIAGPVCVDKNYRGQGVFESLYLRLFDETASAYDVVLAFVSVANGRSIAAHTKVGMNAVDKFHYGDREFFIVARLLR